MTKFTEGRHPGEFILSEANFHRSRSNVTVAAGSGVIQPGHVLGQITASKKFAPSPAATTTGFEGAETAKAIAIYGGDATTEDLAISVIDADAEVKGFALSYDISVDTDPEKATKVSQLRNLGIKVLYA